jgi:hypothetical protein
MLGLLIKGRKSFSNHVNRRFSRKGRDEGHEGVEAELIRSLFWELV